jgi:hypothetical protein
MDRLPVHLVVKLARITGHVLAQDKFADSPVLQAASSFLPIHLGNEVPEQVLDKVAVQFATAAPHYVRRPPDAFAMFAFARVEEPSTRSPGNHKNENALAYLLRPHRVRFLFIRRSCERCDFRHVASQGVKK